MEPCACTLHHPQLLLWTPYISDRSGCPRPWVTARSAREKQKRAHSFCQSLPLGGTQGYWVPWLPCPCGQGNSCPRQNMLGTWRSQIWEEVQESKGSRAVCSVGSGRRGIFPALPRSLLSARNKSCHGCNRGGWAGQAGSSPHSGGPGAAHSLWASQCLEGGMHFPSEPGAIGFLLRNCSFLTQNAITGRPQILTL